MTIWLYPLRINKKKHPAVCEKLDSKKDKDGIALYIRQLVERDIAEEEMKNKHYMPAQLELSASVAEVELTEPEPTYIPKVKQTVPVQQKVVEPLDDFGGGLA